MKKKDQEQESVKIKQALKKIKVLAKETVDGLKELQIKESE